MPREDQYSLRQLRQPTPIRTWNQTDLGDRYRPPPFAVGHLADDVSPISTPSQDEIPPLVPPKSSNRPGPYAGNLYRRDGFTEQQPPAISQAPVIQRKPIEVDVQPVPPPPSARPPRNHNEKYNGRPRPLQSSKNGASRWTHLIYNISFLIIPTLFLALGLVLGTLDGKPTNSRQHWGTYQNLMKIAGTLFPIAFALLVGRAGTKVAAYLLQHGTTLGKLEQMIGSRTVSGAIVTQFRLRSFNFVGFGLIACWLLSPVGSQGFLRLVSPVMDSRTVPSLVPYFTTDTESMFSGNNSISSNPVRFSVFRSMFTAALLSPLDSMMGPMDLWSNVKIPYLSSIQTGTGGDWVTLSLNDSVLYSSLVGIPITTSDTGETDLSIESSYMDFNCGNPTRTPEFLNLQPFSNDSDPSSSTLSLDNGTSRGINSSVGSSALNTTATWSIGLDAFISPNFNGSSSATPSSKSCQPGSQGYIASPCSLRDIPPTAARTGTLLLQSLEVVPNGLSTPPWVDVAFCQLSQVYVQSQVSCTSAPNTTRVCRVIAQRRSQGDHAPSALTPLSFPEIFEAISLHLPRSFGTEESSSISDPSIFYISDLYTSNILNATGVANLSLVPAEILSQRLGQVINTYYTLSQAYPLIAQGSPAQHPDNPSALSTTKIFEELYQVSWPWFIFLIISVLVMLLSGLATTILSLQTRNPDILGYSSTMVRDLKHVDLPVEGGIANGIQLARINRDLKLKMKVVEETEGSRVVILGEKNVLFNGS